MHKRRHHVETAMSCIFSAYEATCRFVWTKKRILYTFQQNVTNNIQGDNTGVIRDHCPGLQLNNVFLTTWLARPFTCSQASVLLSLTTLVSSLSFAFSDAMCRVPIRDLVSTQSAALSSLLTASTHQTSLDLCTTGIPTQLETARPLNIQKK